MRIANRPRPTPGEHSLPFFCLKFLIIYKRQRPQVIKKTKAASYKKDQGRKLRLHFFAGPNTQEKKTGRYIDRSRVGKVLNPTKYPTIYVFIYVNYNVYYVTTKQ